MTSSPQPTATIIDAPRRPRQLFIDNLRIVLTAMVVLHHAALTYSHIPLWYYTETGSGSSGYLLDALVAVDQMFFMGFFFMISGYFVPSSFDRKGAGGFLRGRLVRLGVPLLLFALVIRPIVTFNDYLANWVHKAAYPVYYILSWDPGPMWFVEVLLVFCLGYTLLRRRASAPPAAVEPDAASPAAHRPSLWAALGFVAALSVVTWLWRIAVPLSAYIPVLGLPSAAFLPQYLGLFVVGALAFRRGWFSRISRRTTWWALVAAVVCLPAYVVVLASGTGPAFGWRALVGSALECGFAVGIITFLMGLFQRRFNRQRAFGTFLSRNAFGVYFLHPLILVGLGYALSGWQAPAFAKFAALAALGLPLCWAAASLLRRLPGARRVF
ncbi:MAG TPA: acyltransferase family protein [Stackebrandtia sp.]|uniref:acyltransferase family protein n=1 Tax=Stackebrandtia sp. TaxID=2023065 RepID=UPI002D2AE340|nr:acyltransferase family protein [Stackebrandtia sp.]HZE38235.1 acyltransferase family protein [Stackebrandtia sp.]